MMSPFILAMLACSGDSKETGSSAPATVVDGVDSGTVDSVETTGRTESVGAIVDAARAFLAALDEPQRASVQFGLEHPERADWSNLPHAVHERRGVSFGELDAATVGLGWKLIRACLSAEGDQRARSIMRMEDLLWNDGDENADPGNYFFSFFDDPGTEAMWGWQLDGHHLALNFTVSEGRLSMAPSLWGTTPKSWPTGPFAGLAPMSEEEDRAFAWMASLSVEQRAMAQLDAGANPNLMAGPSSAPDAWPEPAGLSSTELTEAQRAALVDWIAVYVNNLADGHASDRMAEIEATLDDVSVAWMGGTVPGSMMYYRIQGSRVLIEFDHTVTADHIHAVYRDPLNDYGVNWLGKHRMEHHSH